VENEGAGRWGLPSGGVAVLGSGGVTRVVDIVGRGHDPPGAEGGDEARRLGISRRAPRTIDFAQISTQSRLLLAHAHADVVNAAEFPTDAVCPCHVQQHVASGFQGMCARLWWQEPLQGAHHRLALFASFPISQVEVVTDKAGGSHVETMRLASVADVPVIEVER